MELGVTLRPHTRSRHQDATTCSCQASPAPCESTLLLVDRLSGGITIRSCVHTGPVNIHDSVLREMDRPGSNHRDPWFAPFFAQVLEDSKYIFQTKNASTVIYPGTGTGGWEASLQNTLSPGDKVVTFRYGQFSHLWVDQMQVGVPVDLTHAASCVALATADSPSLWLRDSSCVSMHVDDAEK